MKFDFNDILIEPEVTTFISSRSTINPMYLNNNPEFIMHLPIIAAPMDTVVSAKNYDLFNNANINVCLPRNEKVRKLDLLLTAGRMVFHSYSLTEVEQQFIKGTTQPPKYILIDIANGHMQPMMDAVQLLKQRYGNAIRIMAGNVAHPDAYKKLSLAGADFVRVGIGNGAGCLTTENTGIGYPMASLVRECYEVSCTINDAAKIVADGGMKSYSDIIKALALGADYVMLGSILNKTIESCGDNYLYGIKISQDLAEKLFKNKWPIMKKFRGMSTKEVQKKWGKEKLTTSEGVVRFRKVEYTLKQWTDNFTDYLKSAMSYTNATSLDEFIGKVKYNLITTNAYERYHK